MREWSRVRGDWDVGLFMSETRQVASRISFRRNKKKPFATHPTPNVALLPLLPPIIASTCIPYARRARSAARDTDVWMSKRPKAVLGTTAETTRRSTRAKIRDESESISQPDTSRLTRSRRNTRTDQGGIERIGLESIQSVTTQTSSGSTAVLPDHFDVLLGCEPGKGPLDVSQAEQVWVQGAEILADARRAGGEEEGRLDHLREVVASRRGGVFVAGTRPEEAAPRDKLKKDIMWYTAAFSVPYTCE